MLSASNQWSLYFTLGHMVRSAMEVVSSPVTCMKVLLCTSSWWDEHSHPEGGRMTH